MGAIVLAAGSSLRLAGALPKPFRPLAGRPVLEYSLRAFAAVPSVGAVVVVVPNGQRGAAERTCAAFPVVVAVTLGGALRQDSLACGLACLPAGVEVVAVHDAARPMISPEVIAAVLAGVGEGFDGAIAALPLDDALKEVDQEGEIRAARSRAGLWRAQTPQAFTRSCLDDALAQARRDGEPCDDCSQMATRAGYRVRVVNGDPLNLKVTRPADLDLCERLLGPGTDRSAS